MKILIAYAGYEDNVINDLMLAGLPEQAEVLVLSIIGWQSFFGPTGDANSMGKMLFFDKDTTVLENANRSISSVCQELQIRFPLWQIEQQVHFGTPPQEVMQTVTDWHPDIIFVGSYNGSVTDKQTTGTFEHFLFGGVSKELIAKAECSIHFVRGEKQAMHNPVKIIIGIDDSPEDLLTVELVKSRNWPADSQVKIITCIDKLPSDEISPDANEISPDATKNGKEVLEEIENRPLTTLTTTPILTSGLSSVSLSKSGKPVEVFLQEANDWGADCIFIGDKKPEPIKDFLFGSMTNDLITQARCSVEVVRNKLL